MAYLDSLIGFTTGTILEPDPPSTTDSPIGFVTGGINDPASSADSAIGFTVGRVRNPHFPIGVLTPTGKKYVPLRVNTP